MSQLHKSESKISSEITAVTLVLLCMCASLVRKKHHCVDSGLEGNLETGLLPRCFESARCINSD